MGKSLKGSKTEKNLLISFAGESQARNRYTFFASTAKKEGFEQISAIFTETAEQEKEHAKKFFKYLEGGNVEITASYPAGVIGNTAQNLEAADAGEHGEWSHDYPEFAKVAKEFRLIEQETKTIFICKEPEAKEILDEIKTKGTSKERMRKAGQYCVQIYGDFFGKLNGAGMLQLVSEDIQDFYELVSMDQYSEDYGLDYAMDNGIAIFV